MITPDTEIENLSVKEKVELVVKSKGLLIDILENIKIDCDLILENCFINHLPKNLAINGMLIVINCVNLTRINDGLYVRNSFHIIGCGDIEYFSDDVYVGGNLWTVSTNINMDILKRLFKRKVKGSIMCKG